MLEMAAQLGKFTENHLIVHLRMGGFYSIYFTHPESCFFFFFLKKNKNKTKWQWQGQGKSAKLQWVQFSRSVVSDSLRPHGLQHARPPCLSPTPGAYLNSCPLSW